jgi:uncharacterized protein (UPF0261 family)
LVVDDGILGKSSIPADITREEVAEAAGTTLEQIKAIGDENKAVELMTAGLCKTIKKLYQSGRLDGVLSIGGGMGTIMATTAMKELPIGVPKLMVSTKVAQTGTAKEFMGTKDITMLSSVADIAGLNRLIKKIVCNAAGAIVGMVETSEPETADRPVVVMTMLGTTTKCGLKVMHILEDKGYEVVVFHSVGVGGMALEDYVKEEPVIGAIELGLNEIGNELFGGMATAGPTRLEAAGRKGVLQIITPGNVDFIAFLGRETVPDKYRNRNLIFHNPKATAMRLNADEMRLLAEVIAKKLNAASGPVKVLIPTRGFSVWDKEGADFYDPQADRIFIDSLKSRLRQSILVSEIDSNINDDLFIQAVVKQFLESAPA